VATVVAKLFNLTEPTAAYFGQKDAQQVVVIRRMARDLNFPLQIVVYPTVREADGLAMSSRNVYLSPEGRRAAAAIPRALAAAGAAYMAGEREPGRLIAAARTVLDGEPLLTLEYIAISDAHTLADVSLPTDAPLLLSLTVRAGETRLLDNTLLPLHLNTREGLTATLGT
jgi:pantoate--beta-alanine ligase